MTSRATQELQRKTLIETKNRTLKCLNGTIRLCKLTEDGAFALFYIPSLGDLTAQESSPPGICHPRQKKKVMPWGQPGGGGEGGLGTAGID